MRLGARRDQGILEALSILANGPVLPNLKTKASPNIGFPVDFTGAEWGWCLGGCDAQIGSFADIGG
jgi:hypothetical protein